MNTQTQDRVIRLPLLVIFVVATIMICLGVVGGMVGQQLLNPQLPPLDNGNKQVSTTVQQISISPNTAITSLIDRTQRSVLLLSQTVGATPTVLATAFAVTNDGLLVTAASTATGSIQAIDEKGHIITISKVGTDELFGLTYFRAANSVITPFDIDQTDSSIGQTLLAVTRNSSSFEPSIASWQVSSYDLPTTTTAIGVQKIMHSQPTTITDGTPLINDDGRVAGIVIDAKQGIALPASGLRDSFNRVANNNIDKNIFSELGLTLGYTFQPPSNDKEIAFVPEVKTVTPGSPADLAGVKKGDILTSINNSPVTWAQSVATQLSAPLPLTCVVQRNGTTQTISMQPKT